MLEKFENPQKKNRYYANKKMRSRSKVMAKKNMKA